MPTSPWAPILSTQAVPVNQLEALPLLTVQQFLSPDGGDTVVYGTRVLKYWSPTALGITAGVPTLDADGGPGNKYQITTPWLDVTPCMFFAFVILRTIPAGNHAISKSMHLCVQYKQTPAETPYLSNNILGIQDPYNGILDLTGSGTPVIFPDIAGPAIERFTALFSPNTGVASTVQNVALIMGPSVRFQLNWLAIAPDANDHSTYSMAIWGSSS
jgi:hypothetical protein